MPAYSRTEPPALAALRPSGGFVEGPGGRPSHLSMRIYGDGTASENLGYVASGSDSDVFHADKTCPDLEGASVIAEPISRFWGGIPWLNKPCGRCTVPRGRHDELVAAGEIPAHEDERHRSPDLDERA